jgi:hypothetical protein
MWYRVGFIDVFGTNAIILPVSAISERDSTGKTVALLGARA